MVHHDEDNDNPQWLSPPAFLDSADLVPDKALGESRNEAKQSSCQVKKSKAKDWYNIQRVHKWLL